jgi:hypothetical protein
MAQLCPVIASSSVLPRGLPPTPIFGGRGAGGEDFCLENLVVMEVKVAMQDGKA